MADALKELQILNQQTDKLFEGIFSIGKSSRGIQQANKPIWYQDVKPNEHSKIDFIQTIDAYYDPKFQSGDADTQFLNNGLFNASLVVLKKNDIKFIGTWEAGEFIGATMMDSAKRKSEFLGGKFINSVFDCDYTSWQTEASNFVSGKILKTQGGMLGLPYLQEGDYSRKKFNIFSIEVGSFLSIGAGGTKNIFEMIKSIDSTGDLIQFRKYPSGEVYSLPWMDVNTSKNRELFKGRTYSMLGIKAPISSISISKSRPYMPKTLKREKIFFTKDSFLKAFGQITVNFASEIDVRDYQAFNAEFSKGNSIGAALENLRSLKRKDRMSGDAYESAMKLISLFDIGVLDLMDEQKAENIRREMKKFAGFDIFSGSSGGMTAADEKNGANITF